MKCPLLAIAYMAYHDEKVFEKCQCLEQKCAWWDTTRKACSIEHIAYSLRILSEELIDIRHKMPQDERIRPRP